MLTATPTPGRPTPGRPTPGRPTPGLGPGPKKNYYPLPDPITGQCPDDSFLITRGTPSQCFVGMIDGTIPPCLDVTDKPNYRRYNELSGKTVPSNKQLGYCAPKVGCTDHTDCPAPLQVDPISGKELQSKVWCAGEHSTDLFPHVQGHCYISAQYPVEYTTAYAFAFDECKKYNTIWQQADCYVAASALHVYADEVLHENDTVKCQERLVKMKEANPRLFDSLEQQNLVYKDIRDVWCSGTIKPFYQKPKEGGREVNMIPSDSGNPVGICTSAINQPSSCANSNCSKLTSEFECRENDCCRYVLGSFNLPPPFPPIYDWDPSQGIVNYGLIPRSTPGRPTPGRPTPGRPTPGRP